MKTTVLGDRYELMDKIGEGQQKLNKDLESMKQQSDKNGKSASSKEFAQMAAQQAALRKALRAKTSSWPNISTNGTG